MYTLRTRHVKWGILLRKTLLLFRQSITYSTESCNTLLLYFKTKTYLELIPCVYGHMCDMRYNMHRLDWIFLCMSFSLPLWQHWDTVTVNPEKTCRGSCGRMIDTQRTAQYGEYISRWNLYHLSLLKRMVSQGKNTNSTIMNQGSSHLPLYFYTSSVHHFFGILMLWGINKNTYSIEN